LVPKPDGGNTRLIGLTFRAPAHGPGVAARRATHAMGLNVTIDRGVAALSLGCGPDP
jgi:hypothetical protein